MGNVTIGSTYGNVAYGYQKHLCITMSARAWEPEFGEIPCNLFPLVEGLKETYVDVQAQLENGTTVIIEMPAYNQTGFFKRIQKSDFSKKRISLIK